MTAICDDLRKQPFVKPPVKKPKKAPDGSTPAYEELENVSEKCVHALNAFRVSRVAYLSMSLQER